MLFRTRQGTNIQAKCWMAKGFNSNRNVESTRQPIWKQKCKLSHLTTATPPNDVSLSLSLSHYKKTLRRQQSDHLPNNSRFVKMSHPTLTSSTATDFGELKKEIAALRENVFQLTERNKILATDILARACFISDLISPSKDLFSHVRSMCGETIGHLGSAKKQKKKSTLAKQQNPPTSSSRRKKAKPNDVAQLPAANAEMLQVDDNVVEYSQYFVN